MCYNSGGYVLQPSAALPEGEAQKVKEAAITHSPHAFVPKKELTEEERRERYRTRIDESIRPYTVETQDAETGEMTRSDINPGTVIINRSILRSEVSRCITLAHEGAHHYLDRFFFLLYAHLEPVMTDSFAENGNRGHFYRLTCVQINNVSGCGRRPLKGPPWHWNSPFGGCSHPHTWFYRSHIS